MLRADAEFRVHLFSGCRCINDFVLSSSDIHASKVGRCATAADSVPTLFYIMSVTEAEALAPKLRGCLLSGLAGTVHHAFLSLRRVSSNCMALQLEHAHVVVVPGYSALDALARPLSFPGRLCGARQVYEGYQQLQSDARLRGKMLVLLDRGSARISQDQTYSWLLLGARRDAFQYGVDISMPTEPTPRCASESASRSYLEPLTQKRYLISFKGSFQDRPLAAEVAAFHRDRPNVVVVDDVNAGYDSEFLLWNSIFNLVVATADDRDARFNEVVCAGGIPVAMADATWVPPFDGFIRFSSYGVLVDTDPSMLLPRLRDVLVNRAEVYVLRESLG